MNSATNINSMFRSTHSLQSTRLPETEENRITMVAERALREQRTVDCEEVLFKSLGLISFTTAFGTLTGVVCALPPLPMCPVSQGAAIGALTGLGCGGSIAVVGCGVWAVDKCAQTMRALPETQIMLR